MLLVCFSFLFSHYISISNSEKKLVTYLLRHVAKKAAEVAQRKEE